jgi:prepilin-type N-terminal cleavage/methylation domain-containing protein
MQTKISALKKWHKWFTLIEMIIVIVIIWILSILLFRTLADMTRISGRIEFEKILAKNLITIHTTTNYLAEQYPHINMSGGLGWYNPTDIIQGWYVQSLQLIDNNNINTASLIMSWETLYLKESKNPTIIPIITDKRMNLTGIMFRILPTVYNTGLINLPLDKFNAEWFWMFGTLTTANKREKFNDISLNLQHFVHLKQ